MSFMFMIKTEYTANVSKSKRIIGIEKDYKNDFPILAFLNILLLSHLIRNLHVYLFLVIIFRFYFSVSEESEEASVEISYSTS